LGTRRTSKLWPMHFVRPRILKVLSYVEKMYLFTFNVVKARIDIIYSTLAENQVEQLLPDSINYMTKRSKRTSVKHLNYDK